LHIFRHLEGNSQLVVIKNAGHAVNLEKPKDVCRNIIGFFKEPITEASNEETVCKLWAAPSGRIHIIFRTFQSLMPNKSRSVSQHTCIEMNTCAIVGWFHLTFFGVHIAGVALYL
jgi:hypothetical protein